MKLLILKKAITHFLLQAFFANNCRNKPEENSLNLDFVKFDCIRRD